VVTFSSSCSIFNAVLRIHTVISSFSDVQASSVFLYCLAPLPRNTCMWNESACLPQQWELSLELLFNISCNFLIQTHFLKYFIRKSLYNTHTNILPVEGLWLIINFTTFLADIVWKELANYCMSLTDIKWVQIGDDIQLTDYL